ncbi:MAG: 2-C-methyl-D-erythritol 4-phosphate cytidylyltransferase [Desulfamplus sp.]|nr:2-C-methyl-D-erythritol 4-phosphate cytidylyltransferase [Desulfamplus sp.]
MKKCEIYAVIVAGGKGLRMDSEIRKQYIEISGISVLARTLELFSRFKSFSNIVLVIPEGDMQYCFENIILSQGLDGKICMVSGGSERQHSVMNGLKKVRDLSCSQKPIRSINDSCYQKNMGEYSGCWNTKQNGDIAYVSDKSKLKIVLIHDGVRPFVDHNIITRCIEGALEYGACIPVVPVVDTLKRKDSNGFAANLVDRKNLYQVQTPQAFDLDLILKAHEQALSSGISATDDSSLVELIGKKVFMTSGSVRNIKITTKDDLLLAEYMISMGTKGYSY